MKNQIDEIKELWEDDPSLSDEELDKNFDIGSNLTRCIVKSKNTEALPDLLELFTDRNEDFGGVCETLQNDIESNYTVKQIIKAVSHKFNYLIENDLDRFANLSQNFLRHDVPEAFIDFRSMFNKLKPQRADDYVDAVDEWVGKYFPKEISLPREDIKKW